MFNWYLILAALPPQCWLWKQKQAFEKLLDWQDAKKDLSHIYPVNFSNIITLSTPFSGWPKKARDAFSLPKCLVEKALVPCRWEQSCSVLRNWRHSSASVWFARESLLGTLRSNDATATRTSLKKWICVPVFMTIIPTYLLSHMYLLNLNSKGPYSRS